MTHIKIHYHATYKGLPAISHQESAKSGGAGVNTGNGYELEAIAACTIGGVSVNGGIGRISGVLIGVLVFEILKTCLQYLGVDTNYQYIAQGIVIVVAIALSDGANIALEFASLFPERTLSVIAVSGNITPDGLILPVRLFCIGKYYFYRILSTLFRTCFLSQKRPRRVGSPASHPQKKGHAFADMVYSHVFRCQQLASLLCNSPLMTKEQLHAIQAPVLLLAGTRDLVKTSHSRLMARLIPRAQLVLVNGATHTSMFGRKQFYLNVILDFLKGCPAAPFGCMAAKKDL